MFSSSYFQRFRSINLQPLIGFHPFDRAFSMSNTESRMKNFFRIIVFGLLSIAGAFLVGRELLLLYTSVTLTNQVNTVKLYSKNPTIYEQACLAKFPDITGGEALDGFQLRFLDETNYVIEAVCKFHDNEPIVIRAGGLPQFAKHMAGSSGLFFDPSNAPSKFAIDVFGRSSSVAIGSVGDTMEPATSCTGWGYQCCDAQTQVALGVNVGNKAIDCPGRCVSICKSRPVVLSFAVDPQMTPERVTTLARVGNQPLQATFTYVVSDPDGSVTSVLLDFGDGQSQKFTDSQTVTQNVAAHNYACPGTQLHCSFTATLTVTDNEGYVSPDTPGAKILVKL
jgi:hypothetical protein